MKRLLVTHVDLDGAGPIILYDLFPRLLKFDRIICKDYGFEQDSSEYEFLTTFEEIIFVDMSIPELTYESLKLNGIKVLFYDHHESSSWLSLKEGIGVWDNTRCGTKIFWEEYVRPQLKRYIPMIDYVVDLIDAYDCWRTNDPLWKEAKNLNSVFYGLKDYREPDEIKALQKFLDITQSKITRGIKWFWTEREKVAIDRANAREKEVKDAALQTMKVRKDKEGLTFAIFKAPSKISLVCSSILDERPELDYIICINTYGESLGKLSFRSKKEDFDLNSLACAKGHIGAAGGSLSEENINRLWDEEYCFAYKSYSSYKEDDENSWLISLK